MKILYIIVTLNLLKLVALKSLETTKSSRYLAQDLLIKLYENDMFFVDKNYVENAKNISVDILKDKTLQKAATIPLQDFKEELNDFLQEYLIYSHYGLYNKLVTIYGEITRSFYFLTDHPDSSYIKKLLRKHGYNSLKEKYGNEFKRFISKIVLTKFEEFIKKHSSTCAKFTKQILDWSKELKECQQFYCYKRLYDSLIDILYTPREKVLRTIKMNLNVINVEHLIEAQDVIKSLLNDSKLSQLNTDLKGNLIKEINNFIKQYKSDKNIENLNNLLHNFECNLSVKYYNNREIPIKQRELLRNIFDDNDYSEMKEHIENSVRDFIESDLPWIFEKRNNKTELPIGKDLWDWFDYVEDLETYEESVKAFENLKDLKKIKSKNIISFGRV